MRVKNEIKQEALFRATIKVVNENGFVSSSVAKIAREAGVSPATLYIYYKNKEDLIISAYIDIKKGMSQAILKNIDTDLPIRDIFKNMWFNIFNYISGNLDFFQFTEQFANSPYSEKVDKNEVEKYFEPIIQIVQRGIDQKIIKAVNFDILSAFIFYPIMVLSNPRLCKGFESNKTNIETAFTLAWDAIKF